MLASYNKVLATACIGHMQILRLLLLSLRLSSVKRAYVLILCMEFQLMIRTL